MKIEEINSGNNLIAEFMGLPSYDNTTGKYWLHPLDKNKTVPSLDYHTSWDWLMPVVEKIERLTHNSISYSVKIEGGLCEIFHGDELDFCAPHKEPALSKIMATWKCIQYFLKVHKDTAFEPLIL